MGRSVRRGIFEKRKMFCPYRGPVNVLLPVSNRVPGIQQLLRNSLHTLTGARVRKPWLLKRCAILWLSFWIVFDSST